MQQNGHYQEREQCFPSTIDHRVLLSILQAPTFPEYTINPEHLFFLALINI
jgi:hypothetical protein